MEATLGEVIHIRRKPTRGILMSSKKNNKLITYCDVDWEECPKTRSSMIGFLVKHGDSLIS